MELTEFEQAVLNRLKETQPGDVLTYGELAAEAGYPGAARAVGNTLRNLGSDYPWWRVVNSQGRLHPHGSLEQAKRLKAEGVLVANDRVTFS